MIVFLSAICGRMAFALPAAATVGNPSDPGALAQEMQQAYAQGARQIIIHPGVYLLPHTNHADFNLNGWSNSVISGYHVTLIMTDLQHDCFKLNQCKDVTLEGPIISQDAVTFYQGKVIAVGKGADGRPYIIWRPDMGYPVPTAADKTFLGGDANVIDSHTRRLKRGLGDFYGIQYKALNDGSFRAEMGGNIVVGDWLVGRHGPAPFKAHLINCHDCTIKDVTFMRNGFAPLREEGGGGNHYFHDLWKLGPKPKGAIVNPLVTNAADGMHMTGSYPGPDIEECVMTGVFLDDCIAIHGYFQSVIRAALNTITINGASGQLIVGQPIRVSNENGFYGEADVTAVKANADGTTTATLSQSLNVPDGAKFSNPLQDGAGYKIIDCQIGDTRSRGILAKADHGLIKGNRIIGCGMSAVSLGPEYYWGEADYVHHVVVEDNLIQGSGNAGYGGAACFIHGHGAIGNQDIVVRSNRFLSNYQGDFDVQWVKGAVIEDNKINGAKYRPSMVPKQTMMHLANDRQITLRGNKVKNAGAYRVPLVAVGANVKGLSVRTK